MSRMLPLFLLAACEPAPVPPECHGTSREVAPDEPVGEGFTAEEILAFATGSFDAEVEEPDGDRIEVRVDVSYAGGRLLACEGETIQLTGTVDGATTAEVDRLDLEVDVVLSTSDGRFDHARATTFLSANSTDGTSTRYGLEGDTVEVWLAWTPDFFEGEVSDRVENVPMMVWP